MQIRKTYRDISPELLYYEIKDFASKYGAKLAEEKLETFSSPVDSSSFTTRGTLIFKIPDPVDKAEKECLRAHIVGSARNETKLMLDFADSLFPEAKISALQSDLDFVFGSYEVPPGQRD